MKFSFVPQTFFRVFFQDQDQDHDQNQDFTMKFIKKSYASYTKDTHQIWCRAAKFLSKSKSCSGSGSWFYFGFQYPTYISYIEDTHQILFGSSDSFESYCVHRQDPRTYVQPDRQTNFQTDRRTFFCLFCVLRYPKHEHSSKGEFFFQSCYYNTFLHNPYVMRR